MPRQRRLESAAAIPDGPHRQICSSPDALLIRSRRMRHSARSAAAICVTVHDSFVMSITIRRNQSTRRLRPYHDCRPAEVDNPKFLADNATGAASTSSTGWLRATFYGCTDDIDLRCSVNMFLLCNSVLALTSFVIPSVADYM